MKRDGRNAGTTSPPADKALVYVIEQMPAERPLTTHVKLGIDGSWLAQLSKQSTTGAEISVAPPWAGHSEAHRGGFLDHILCPVLNRQGRRCIHESARSALALESAIEQI